MKWKFKNKNVTEIPEDYFGFVYCITNLTTNEIYVGKKQFTFKRKRKITKKEKELTKTRKKTEVVNKESDWQTYYGSSKQLQLDVKSLGEDNFKREILHFCKSKSELTYWEAYYQFKLEVLLKPSYNGWISCKVYKSKL